MVCATVLGNTLAAASHQGTVLVLAFRTPEMTLRCVWRNQSQAAFIHEYRNFGATLPHAFRPL